MAIPRLEQSRNKLIPIAALLIATATVAGERQNYTFAPGELIAVDGDTLRAGEKRIRLSAIDAPELSQTCRDASDRPTLCGRDARDALSQLIEAGTTVCEVVELDRYRRDVATCTVNGRDIGESMIADGHAIAYLRYGGARYEGYAYAEGRRIGGRARAMSAL